MEEWIPLDPTGQEMMTAEGFLHSYGSPYCSCKPKFYRNNDTYEKMIIHKTIEEEITEKTLLP